ncbi:AmpG [Rickettsiales bacterium Ac37b]|nr:AmpG [Rickettsiales bacterium Ac37b]
MRNKFITALTLGINSGLNYALIDTLITAYFNDAKINLVVIGILSLRLVPYYIRYLWAPIVDRIPIRLFPKNFGHRKGWLLCTQAIFMCLVIALSFIDITDKFLLTIIVIFMIAFTAATYDISMEAYRIELFEKNALNLGSSYTVIGFRIGLLISGAFGLYLSSILLWKYTFIIISMFIIPCMVVIFFSKDANIQKGNNNLKQEFCMPFKAIFKQPMFIFVFVIIAFYKVSDAYLDTMLLPFLMETGFSKGEIASVNSVVRLIASICGTFIGGYIVRQKMTAKHLFYTEIFAALTNLLFIFLIKSGHNMNILVGILCVESLCSGICNIMLINYMSNLCNKEFVGTHYAILISISGFSRSILASTSGFVAVNLGWYNFFIISSLLSIPSLLCIYWLYIYKHKTILPYF